MGTAIKKIFFFLKSQCPSTFSYKVTIALTVEDVFIFFISISTNVHVIVWELDIDFVAVIKDYPVLIRHILATR